MHSLFLTMHVLLACSMKTTICVLFLFIISNKSSIDSSNFMNEIDWSNLVRLLFQMSIEEKVNKPPYEFVCLYLFIISKKDRFNIMNDKESDCPTHIFVFLYMLIISNKTIIDRLNIVNNTDESNWPQHMCLNLSIISNNKSKLGMIWMKIYQWFFSEMYWKR